MSAMDSNNPKPTLLKETREAKGLTLDIVHEATKIPLDALKAIEEGYTLRMMSPFYYRGFLKMYAEFLGLDVAEVHRLYGLHATDRKSHTALRAASAAKMAQTQSNYGKEQIQEWFSIFFKKKNLLNATRAVAVLVVLMIGLRIGGCMVNGIKAKMSEKPKIVAVVREEKHTGVKKQDKKSESNKEEVKEKSQAVVVFSDESQSGPIKAQSADQKVALAVHAFKDTAVQVKADGKVVFQMTMKKGTMESWNAKNEIVLSGKNINELDIEVNGKHIGPLGSAERKAKKVVITKEGLTVKK